MFFTVNLLQDQSKISNYLSNTLISEMEKVWEKWERILLYLNKRGAYSSLICEDCQYLFQCPNCDTSLSVHKNPEKLLCHLCTSQYKIPLFCKNCKGTHIRSVGVGTQQVEAVLRSYFSWKNIYRFDSDSMKNISSKKEALEKIKKADIIIGTKMVSTGFNFEGIWLIGVILVEQELTFPSFDAEEKAYQNLKQLIGRGNRKSQKTKIILQTFIPKNPTLLRLTHNNFKEFFSETLQERKDFLYPPYKEMVTLEYRHKNESQALKFIQKIEKKLQEYNTKNTYQILCGTTSFRKNNSYHVSCIVKWENIRNLLQNIESIILRESALSVIFS